LPAIFHFLAWGFFIPLPAIFKSQQSCDFSHVVPGHVTFSKVVDNSSKVQEIKKSFDYLLSSLKKMQNTKKIGFTFEIFGTCSKWEIPFAF